MIFPARYQFQNILHVKIKFKIGVTATFIHYELLSISMYSRRKLLVGICLSTTVAGCSGSQSTNDSGSSDDQSRNSTPEASKSDASVDSLPETTITIENISYGFGGLKTWINLRKDTTEPLRINVAAKAYNNDELIGEASQYVTFTSGKRITLEIESVSEMADNGIDDVTEFVIEARPTGGKTYEVRMFSTGELKEKIESTEEVSNP